MICPGCKVDLSLALEVPVTMDFGKLHMACPVCRTAMKISVEDDGTVIHRPIESSTKETKVSS